MRCSKDVISSVILLPSQVGVFSRCTKWFPRLNVFVIKGAKGEGDVIESMALKKRRIKRKIM